MQAGENGFTPELLRQLTTQAADAADHAYAPYSKFRVGAALLLQNGAIVTGANVENAFLWFDYLRGAVRGGSRRRRTRAGDARARLRHYQPEPDG